MSTGLPTCSESEGREQEFEEGLMSVVVPAIVLELQSHGTRGLRVVGGRAMDAVLRDPYRVRSIDWDLEVWDPESHADRRAATHAEQRDRLGRGLAQRVAALADARAFQLSPLELDHGVRVTEFVYEVNTVWFESAFGDRYQVGHVEAVTDAAAGSPLRRVGLCDLVPVPPVPSTFAAGNNDDDYTDAVIDGVRFAGPATLERNLRAVLALPGYKKKLKARGRLAVLQEAAEGGWMSCSYYRAQATSAARGLPGHPQVLLGREMAACAHETVGGPQDPLFLRRFPPRLRISRGDVEAHDRYLADALTREQLDLVRRYTDEDSGPWNVSLIERARALAEGDPAPPDLPPEVRELQDIVLGAPPLRRDAWVYKVARYLVITRVGPTKAACRQANADLRREALEPQPAFNSTTYDNQHNFAPHWDPLAPCCFFAIKVPAGSRVLIIGRHSVYPRESEVLLPHGCGFYVLTDPVMRQVTYQSNAPETEGDIVYNETVSHDVLYVAPQDMPPANTSTGTLTEAPGEFRADVSSIR